MSARRVITHVVESEPLFVTISHQRGWFASALTGNGIHWQHFAVEQVAVDQDQSATVEMLAEAHRIILDTANLTDAERDGLVQLLTPFQNSVRLLVPVSSFWELQVQGEIPGWQQAAYWQRNNVLFWVAALPSAEVLFLRDVLDWQAANPFALLLTQHQAEGMLFAPDGRVAPLVKKQLTTTLLQLIGAPAKSSVLLQGSEYVLSGLLERVVPLYETMYHTSLQLQRVKTTTLPLLPFPCRIKELATPITESADNLLNLLASPSVESAIVQHRAALFQQLQDDPWCQVPEEVVVTETPTAEVESAPLPIEPAPLVNEPPLPVVPPTPANKSLSSDHSPTAHPATPSAAWTTADNTTSAATPPATPPSPPPSPTLTETEKEGQLKEDVRRLFAKQDTHHHVATIRRQSVQRQVIRKKSRKRTLAFYLGLVFVASGLGLAALLGSLQLTQQLAQRELTAVTQDITQLPVVQAEAIRWRQVPSLFALMQPQARLLDTLFSLPAISTSQQLVIARAQLNEAVAVRSSLNQHLVAAYATLVGQVEGDLNQIISLLTEDAAQAEKLATSLGETASQLPDPLATSLASASGHLLPDPTARKNELLTKTLLSRLGPLAGTTGLKRYAVVLQNSQELQPTGGVIEAVAVLTFNEGSLISQDVYTGYQLDDRLPGEIKPPPDLGAFTQEDQWWLHNANWYTDGAASGRQVIWFVEKALSQPLDGALFINTAGLPHLFSALGPLDMPAFNEVLTEKNINERLEFHNVSVRVTDDKPDYRQQLLKQLIIKLTTLPQEQVPTLLRTLRELLDDEQLLLTFIANEDQQLFRQLGWTGDLTFPVCPSAYATTGCFADGIAIVETNIGVNRANAYIDRIQKHQADLTAVGVRHTRTITYTNTARTSAWPKGDYQVYVRTYIPGKPTNVKIIFDEAELPTKTISVRETEFGTELAFVVRVPVQATKALVLHYDQPTTLSPTSTYVFYENRQPGLSDDLPSLVMTYPEVWKVASHVPSAVVMGAQLEYPTSPTPYLMRAVQFSPAQ